MGEEANLQIGNDLVTLAQASRYLAESAMGRQDWSGLPVPIPGLDLIIEPRYKHKYLDEFRWKECYDENGVRQPIEEKPAPKVSEYTWVNSWWNARYQFNIVVVKDKQGRARFTVKLCRG